MEKLGSDFKYVVNAAPNKVWDLIGRAIFEGMGSGLTNMKVFDENNFRADLLVKVLGFFPMPMKLQGEVTDMSPPDTMSVKLTMSGLGGFIKSVMAVNFRTTAVGDDKTEVHNWATLLKLEPAIIVLGSMFIVKGQAKDIFNGIRKKLDDWI
jgi:carbon monoxide dehydrogenase subunit G